MSDAEEIEQSPAIRRLEKGKKCAKCVVCCPCNFTVDCARELRDTAIYCCLCPQRCMQERERKKKIRQEKGITHAEEIKKNIRECFTPSPDCCGETHQDSCVCCFVSPKNWCKFSSRNLIFCQVIYELCFCG